MPGSLAKAPLLSGLASLLRICALLVACIVIGRAATAGIGVSSALTPWTAKLSSVAELPGSSGAVDTVKGADGEPIPPEDSTKVVVPVSVSAGCDEKLKPVGNVTVKREFTSS